MISFDEAIAIVRQTARPLATEIVELAEGHGRTLSKAVVAAIDSPRADVSAMDGYAVRSCDLGAYPARLELIGESLPGTGIQHRIEAGTCARIFTGAPLPAGADRIVIQERVRREGEFAVIEADPGPAAWVRRRGKDFAAGDEVLPRGRTLDPAALIAAAGADVAQLEVFGRPRLALITTGDELVDPGQARDSALAVPDSVTLGLSSFAAHWGAQVVMAARLPDDLHKMRPIADQAAGMADLVVVAGGASVSDRDFAKAMFEPLGLELLFSKVSIRPGKPAWFGRIGGKLVLGLPGNPTSALVTARLFLAPLLTVLQGGRIAKALAWQPATLTAPLPGCDARETFHRGSLFDGKVTLADFQESHAQKALAGSDVLVRQAANSPGAPAGETVMVLEL